ncbi:MAG: hypothetical protein J0M27_08955, partial [Sulfuritalea sp.]|nr:hypothetical protein [Sulfuritalea sp.]
GRSRAILIDPNTASGLKVFAAGVGGGLWVTTDISSPTPNWTAVNDLFSNLAITTLAAAPSTPLTMYFGTGEGYFNIDSIRGNGIWKSVDGGANWTQLPNTANASFHYVQKIVVTSAGAVLAATQSGVQRSAGGGFRPTGRRRMPALRLQAASQGQQGGGGPVPVVQNGLCHDAGRADERRVENRRPPRGL